MKEENKSVKLTAEQLNAVAGGQLDHDVPWAKSRVIKDCPVFLLGSEESEKVGFLYAGREIYVYKHDDGGLGMYPFEAAGVPGYYGTNKIAYIKGENLDISGDWHDYVYR